MNARQIRINDEEQPRGPISRHAPITSRPDRQTEADEDMDEDDPETALKCKSWLNSPLKHKDSAKNVDLLFDCGMPQTCRNYFYSRSYNPNSSRNEEITRVCGREKDLCKGWHSNPNLDPFTIKSKLTNQKLAAALYKRCGPQHTCYFIDEYKIRNLPTTINLDTTPEERNIPVDSNHSIRMKINHYLDALDLPSINERHYLDASDLTHGRNKVVKIWGKLFKLLPTQPAPGVLVSPLNEMSTVYKNLFLQFIPNINYIFSNGFVETTNSTTKLEDIIKDREIQFDITLIKCVVNSIRHRPRNLILFNREKVDVQQNNLELFDLMDVGEVDDGQFNMFQIDGIKYYRKITKYMVTTFIRKRAIFVKDGEKITFNSSSNIFKQFTLEATLKYYNLKPKDIHVKNEFFVPLVVGENILFNELKYKPNARDKNAIAINKILSDKNTIIYGDGNINQTSQYKYLWETIKKPIPFRYVNGGFDVNTFTISPAIFNGPYKVTDSVNLSVCDNLNFQNISTDLDQSLFKKIDVEKMISFKSCNITNLKELRLKSQALSVEFGNNTFEDIVLCNTDVKDLSLIGPWEIDLNLLRSYFTSTETSGNRTFKFRNMIHVNFPDTFEWLTGELHIYFHNCNITSLHPSLLTAGRKLSATFEQCQLSYSNVSQFMERVQQMNESVRPTINVEIFEEPPQRALQLSMSEAIKMLFTKAGKPPQTLNLHEDSCRSSFRLWLLRILTLAQDNVQVILKLLPHIIDYVILMSTNEEFKNEACDIVEGATASCGDRMILSILYLGLQYKLFQASLDITDVKKCYDLLIRGSYILSLLMTVAREKIKASAGVIDEIEVYLGYPISLKADFNIPIDVDDMLYFRCSGISYRDLDHARQFVEQKLNDRKSIVDFLVIQPLWNKILYNQDYTIFEDVNTTADKSIQHTLKLVEQF